MPVKKGSVNGFVWIKFYEHPIVDYRKQSTKLLDVTSEGDTSLASDFIINGEFNDRQYCICLMEMVLGLPEHQLSSFIDYQCAQLKEPYHWVSQFIHLLQSNSKLSLKTTFQEKLDLVFWLLREKKDQNAEYVRNREWAFDPTTMAKIDERFDIVKVKEELANKSSFQAKKLFLLRRRTDYLQEVEENEQAPFIRGLDMELDFLESTIELNKADSEFKKMRLNLTPTQFADIMWQFKELRTPKGDMILEESTSSYVRFLCRCYCKSDGSSFIDDSIRKFLTRSDNGERLSEKNRIDISEIKIKE